MNTYMTFDEIIVDQATIAHIQDGAQREEKCERWSHQAIVDDPWQIQQVVQKTQRLYINPANRQYFYYYVDNIGKEWVVVVKELAKGYGELRSAYRIDCFSFPCKKDGVVIDYDTILEKWMDCEGFILIFFQ